jgi:hypothetical protein
MPAPYLSKPFPLILGGPLTGVTALPVNLHGFV